MTVTTMHRWTDQKPSEPGWYWYLGKNWIKPCCIEVFRDSHMWCASEHKADQQTWQAIENMDGQWAGPIHEPAY